MIDKWKFLFVSHDSFAKKLLLSFLHFTEKFSCMPSNSCNIYDKSCWKYWQLWWYFIMSGKWIQLYKYTICISVCQQMEKVMLQQNVFSLRISVFCHPSLASANESGMYIALYCIWQPCHNTGTADGWNKMQEYEKNSIFLGHLVPVSFCQ